MERRARVRAEEEGLLALFDGGGGFVMQQQGSFLRSSPMVMRRTPDPSACSAACSFGRMPPVTTSAAEQRFRFVGVQCGNDVAVRVEQAGDVGDEMQLVGAERDGDRRGGAVGIHVQQRSVRTLGDATRRPAGCRSSSIARISVGSPPMTRPTCAEVDAVDRRMQLGDQRRRVASADAGRSARRAPPAPRRAAC